jgi:hypothetical protein
MTVNIPPAIVALLPYFLQVAERGIEKIGILGKGAIIEQLKLDQRPVMKEIFVRAGNAAAVLEAIGTYFDWNRTGNEIITAHLAFFLSVLVAAMESSKQAFKIEGVYVIGLVIIFSSFVVFVKKLLRSSAAADCPFRGWGVWTWVMFVTILGAEAWEHWPLGQSGSHTP